ncbi:MAG: DUF3035 domain-containing protein [Alphaproteobacteria bacterium]|nr:DUF3035 domain-containing protein [Alphaproteobacteria bacterium]
MTSERKLAGVPAGLVLIGIALLLGGCSQFRSALGYEKESPDEFQVVARAPLALPPNYDLRPPVPGAVRPQEQSTSEQAAARILGRPVPSTASSSTTGPAVAAAAVAAVTVNSAGEARLRQQLGVDKADPNIRQIVNAETATFVYGEQYPIDKLLFWRDDPERGVLLNATEEQRRLRENSALGKPVTEGESPTIERKRGSIFQGLF